MKPRYIAALTVFLALWVYLQMSVEDEAGSSYSYGKSGVRAVFLLLEEIKKETQLETVVWRKSFKDLPEQRRNDTLVVAHAPEIANSKQLLNWVEAGNKLVILGTPGGSVQNKMSLNLPLIEKINFLELLLDITDRKIGDRNVLKDGVEIVCPDEIREVCANIKSISPSKSKFITKGEKDYLFALESGNAAFLAYKKQGNGEIWYFADGTFALNDNIDKFDNITLLYQILSRDIDRITGEKVSRGKRVLFDEFHHGYMEPVAKEFESRQDAVIILSVAFLIVLTIVTLSRAIRFGQILVTNNENEARQSDFVAALGLLYKEHGVMEILSNYVSCWKSRTAKIFSVGVNANNEAFINSLLLSGAISEGNKLEYLNALNVLSYGDKGLNKQEIENNISLLEQLS